MKNVAALSNELAIADKITTGEFRVGYGIFYYGYCM